jgi:hypothetical protein
MVEPRELGSLGSDGHAEAFAVGPSQPAPERVELLLCVADAAGTSLGDARAVAVEAHPGEVAQVDDPPHPLGDVHHLVTPQQRQPLEEPEGREGALRLPQLEAGAPARPLLAQQGDQLGRRGWRRPVLACS